MDTRERRFGESLIQSSFIWIPGLGLVCFIGALAIFKPWENWFQGASNEPTRTLSAPAEEDISSTLIPEQAIETPQSTQMLLSEEPKSGLPVICIPIDSNHQTGYAAVKQIVDPLIENGIDLPNRIVYPDRSKPHLTIDRGNI